MGLAEGTNEVFTWLTATNRGAGEFFTATNRGACVIFTAALLNKGITQVDTDLGYYYDPTSKSTLGILAIVGLIL